MRGDDNIMKRVSWGIILDGNPNCMVKNTVLLRIVEKLCLYTWILSALMAVVMIVMSFVQNSGRKLYIGLGFVMGAILLWLCSYIWDEKVRCSYCGHFLALKRISEDQFVDGSERNISRKVYDNSSGVVYDSSGNSAYYTSLSSHRENGKEITKRYAYNMRCSCCGSVCKVEKTVISQQ